jgi:RND family efflux transporter MFP subunit
MIPIKPLVFLVASLFLFSACNNHNSQNKAQVKLVKTSSVYTAKNTVVKTYPSSLQEVEEAQIGFRVAGPIDKILVKEGQFVNKGQTIAQMDPRDYEIQKNAIEAQVVQVQSEYARIAELKSRNSVAENDYEKMKAGKEMAEAKLKNAKDQLSDTRLKAPFSGYITKIHFDEGELVNQGTAIVSMVDVSLYEAEIRIPASIFINKDKISETYFTQENIPGKHFPLEIKSYNIKANNNGLYKLYFQHQPEKESLLSPGMNIMVHLKYDKSDKDIVVAPINSIFEKDNQHFVWTVSKDSTVHAKRVILNQHIEEGMIGIEKGLSANEQIVIGGLHLLEENEKVKINPTVSKTNIGELL